MYSFCAPWSDEAGDMWLWGVRSCDLGVDSREDAALSLGSDMAGCGGGGGSGGKRCILVLISVVVTRAVETILTKRY
jgi:hypothetical protein